MTVASSFNLVVACIVRGLSSTKYVTAKCSEETSLHIYEPEPEPCLINTEETYCVSCLQKCTKFSSFMSMNHFSCSSCYIDSSTCVDLYRLCIDFLSCVKP